MLIWGTDMNFIHLPTTKSMVEIGLAFKTFLFITACWNISICLHSPIEHNIPTSSCLKCLLSGHIESIQEGLSGNQGLWIFSQSRSLRGPSVFPGAQTWGAAGGRRLAAWSVKSLRPILSAAVIEWWTWPSSWLLGSSRSVLIFCALVPQIRWEDID